MDKKVLSERDICTTFITPALRQAGWDEMTQLNDESDIYFQKAIHRVRFGELVNPHYFVIALRVSADDGRLAGFFTGAA